MVSEYTLRILLNKAVERSGINIRPVHGKDWKNSAMFYEHVNKAVLCYNVDAHDSTLNVDCEVSRADIVSKRLTGV